jgi:hypothetical protein
MEGAAIILILIIVLAIAGVLAYFIRDYYKTKEDVDAKLSDTQKVIDASITTEKTDRLSNLKYVVDQVNNVNANIFDTLSSNVNKTTDSINGVDAALKSTIAGLDSVIRFSSNQTISATPSYVPINNLPGIANIDINLIKHVSMISGMTAQNLDGTAPATQVAFCSKESPSNCVRFPNAVGDTYLTSLKSGRNIVMDAPTVLTNTLNLKNTATDASGGVNFTSANKKLKIATDGLSVGPANVDPSATLHVEATAPASAPLFRVKLGASDAILVDATGQVNVPSVNIVSGTNVVGTITTDNTAATPSLKITSKKVTIAGDVQVDGGLSYKSGMSNVTLP